MLKYISIPELNFELSYKNSLSKLKELPRFDFLITIFWLLGPFIYLIERSPADIWLTFIGFAFLIRSAYKNEWKWLNQTWVKLVIAFWSVCFISSFLSVDPLFAIGNSIAWIRFPLYAVALQAWIARDKDLRILMLLMILLGMILMCIILISEAIVEPKLRLTWPYGDTVPGGYLAKVCLPIFCVLIAIATNAKAIPALIASFLGVLTIIVSALTGERTHFLLRACAGILSGLTWKPKFKRVLFIVIIEILAVVLIFTLRPDLGSRYTTTFVNQIPLVNTLITDNKDDYGGYWGAWRGGIQQFVETPIIGIGPGVTRDTCQKLEPSKPEWLPGVNYCGNHPHNFYVQLASDTGLIGLTIGSLMFISIIVSCFRVRFLQPNCPMAATAFVIPFGLLFPIQQFGNFFGQWGNLFLWFALGFAISQIQTWDKKLN